MKAKKAWMPTRTLRTESKPTERMKKRISESFQPTVEKFKIQAIPEKPDKLFNYCIDIYSLWYQKYFYLCQKYKSEFPNRITDEFEIRFLRLTYVREDCFDFSYFRHTGQWHLVAESITLDECKEMILSNPNFQPIG